MKKTLLLLLCSMLLTNVYAIRRYVNINATGADNGTSWDDAFVSLQDALAASAYGDEIFVAAGTYKPTVTTDRTIAFQITHYLKIYGGFNGTETLLSQRQPEVNITILSGDIGTSAVTDNSYHVVSVENLTNTSTVLEGFTITGGYGGESGGGIYMDAAILNLKKCILTGNQAVSGGAIAHHTSGLLRLISCSLHNNTATEQGGGLYVTAAGTSAITESSFNWNQARTGGALHLAGGLATIINSVIAGNTATEAGSAISFDQTGSLNLYTCLLVGNYSGTGNTVYSHPDAVGEQLLQNCTITGNDQVDTGAGTTVLRLSHGSALENCIIYGNTASSQIADTGITVDACLLPPGDEATTLPSNISGNPLFVLPAPATSAPFDTTGLDYHLTLLSPAIDHGNNENTQFAVDFDLLPRIQNDVVDIGIYESAYCASAEISISPAISDNSICIGDALTVSISGGAEHSWSTGSTDPSVTLSETGFYTVIVADAAGCRAEFEVQLSVYSNPEPVLLPTGGHLVTGDFASYQWSFNGTPIPGATTASLAPASGDGAYAVTVTNLAGCSGTSAEFSYYLGLEEAGSAAISIAPNPVAENRVLHISSSGNQPDDLQICLSDVSGKVHLLLPAAGLPQQIDLSGLKPGIYFVEILNLRSVVKKAKLFLL